MKNLKIPIGGMYQEWSCLMDLVEEDTAKTLELLVTLTVGEKCKHVKPKIWALVSLQSGLCLKLTL